MPLGCLLALLLGVSLPVAAQSDDAGGWIEQPRELPVQQDPAMRASRNAARGGAATSVAILFAGLPAEWFLATAGISSSSWVDAQAPLPTGSAQSRGTTAARVSEALRVGVTVPALAAGLLVSGAVALGAVGAAAFLTTGNPLILPLFVAGAVLVAAGGFAVGAVLSANVAMLLGDAAANEAFHGLWSRNAGPDGSAPSSPRPLPPDELRALLSHVALGALQETRWMDHIPVAGPWISAARSREAVTASLVEAREIGGMPRVRDTLQRWADLALYGRALLLTIAWAHLPILALGLVGSGAVLMAGAMQPAALPVVIAGAVALGGVALVGGLGMAAGLVGAQVVWALTPGLLARRAEGPPSDVPVSEKLRAQRRRILTRRPT